MSNAIYDLFKEVNVAYRLIVRTPPVNRSFSVSDATDLGEQIQSMGELSFSKDDIDFIEYSSPWIGKWYLEYLKTLKLNPKNVKISYTEWDKQKLYVDIEGKWSDVIFFETPLMATISEIFFSNVVTVDRFDQASKASKKGTLLYENKCKTSEFGTRRRFSFDVQDIVVSTLKEKMKEYLAGTSNVFFARKYGLKPMGTQAHQWIMAMSALYGYGNANYKALQLWRNVFGDRLGIALSDTYGVSNFLKAFENYRFAYMFDGTRHDSGDPFKYADRMIEFYKRLGIDPLAKSVIFSNSLTDKNAVEIKTYCEGKIGCSFGIGTFLTNDIDPNVIPLNMVVKMWALKHPFNNRWIHTVKLSDDISKATGDENEIQRCKKEILGEQS
jgi:nicotinate phosphoribosyltransferase